MVVSVDIKHIFKYPVEMVADTHLTKYTVKKDSFVFKVETLERTVDQANGIDYRKRHAFCHNILPNIFKRLSFLDVDHMVLEEEAWLNMSTGWLDLKSRNITWAKYAEMREMSKFSATSDNPNWTLFEQHGEIEFKTFGYFAGLLENFAGRYIQHSAEKALRNLEDILQERSARARG